MKSTELPFRQSELNGMSTTRFFRIALQYAGDLYKFYFPEEYRTGNRYPYIRRGQELLDELKETLSSGGGMAATGSLPAGRMTHLTVGAAEKLMAVYRPLNECNLAGKIYEWKVSSAPVAAGEPVRGFNDWNLSLSRYGADPFQTGTESARADRRQIIQPCSFPSQIFTNYILRPLCTFKGLWFFPLASGESEPLPVKIHLKRESYGTVQNWTLREDRTAMSPYVVPVSLHNRVCDEFYFTFEPWFTQPYFFCIFGKFETLSHVEIGGHTLNTPQDQAVLYDTGGTTPVTGTITTGWFKLPKAPDIELYLNSIRVLVQPVFPDYVTENSPA